MTEQQNEAGVERVVRRRASRDIARPPVTAAGDIDELFDRIRTIAAPPKIDASWAKSYRLDPACISVINWLGLAADGKVDAALWARVRIPESRQEALAPLVRRAYGPIFDQVDVGDASNANLQGAFINQYQMGDPKRYVKAFVTLCGHAGIDTGVATAKAAPASPELRPAAVKREPARKAKPAATPLRSPAQPKPIRESTNPRAITLNLIIPAEWTEDEIRARAQVAQRILDELEQL